MQRKWIVLAAGALIGTMLTGCMEKHGELGNRNIREQSVRYDGNGNAIVNKRFANDQMNEMNRMNGVRLNSNNIIGLHKNYRLEMSKDIADHLASMKEINNAYVMMTDNNAYVAVSLKSAAIHNGTAGTLTGSALPLSRTNQAYMRPTSTANNGRYESRSMDMSRGMNSGNTSTDYDMYGTRSSSSITMKETNRFNADDVTAEMKERISAEVKKMAPQIDNVYVSANPDFVSRMTSYMEDVRLGHPIQGFVAEFNALVERIFPMKTR